MNTSLVTQKLLSHTVLLRRDHECYKGTLAWHVATTKKSKYKKTCRRQTRRDRAQTRGLTTLLILFLDEHQYWTYGDADENKRMYFCAQKRMYYECDVWTATHSMFSRTKATENSGRHQFKHARLYIQTNNSKQTSNTNSVDTRATMCADGQQ